MRTTIALATFLVAGAGAVGVSALDLKGSDTLEGVTSALLTDAALDCGGTTNTPAGTLVYIGTGSGNGESAILSGAQQVAPMSRALASAATCAASDGGLVPTAEGIVFALDGLSIVASNATGSSEACNGAFTAACAPQIAKGLAFGGVVINVPGYVCPTATDTAPYAPADASCVAGQYKLLDSEDVLRLVYFGLDHDFKDANQRNCGNGEAGLSNYLRNPGLVRAALVETWGNLFRDSANCTGCTRLWHAFRRNDESGTTDTFVTLMARKATLQAGGTATVAVPSITQSTRRSLFCNTRQAAGVQCVTGTNIQGGFDMVTNPNAMPYRLLALTTLNASSPANAEPPMPPTAPGGPAGAQVNPKAGWDFPDNEFGTIGFAPYYTDLQDADCIRRECSTPGGATQQEQVCSARGDMGLLLPIWDPPPVITTAAKEQDPFAATACNGTWQGVRAPQCGLVGGVSSPSICPNGEKPVGAVCAANNPGTCLQPYTGTAPAYDFRCVNPANNFYGGQRRVDGRVYNLHCHSNDTAPNPDYPYCKSPRINPDAVGTLQVDMVGAYYRIHAQNFLATARPNHFVLRKASDFTPLAAGVAADSTPGGATAACNTATLLAQGKETSATTLIGCYVGSADRCAIGYAGREAGELLGTNALRVDGILPDKLCVRAAAGSADAYPLSRKLYLNTAKGFENVTGDELKMSKCFAQRTIIDPKVNLKGFITLDDNTATGVTQCANFTGCGSTPTPNTACSNNVAPIPQ